MILCIVANQHLTILCECQTRSTTPASFDIAQSQVAAVQDLTMYKYLLTIDSKEEEDFIKANFGSFGEIWLGAQRNTDNMTWSWTTGGPNEGYLIYDQLYDRCYGFCGVTPPFPLDTGANNRITLNNGQWTLVSGTADKMAMIIVEASLREPRISQLNDYDTTVTVRGVDFLPTNFTFVAKVPNVPDPEVVSDIICTSAPLLIAGGPTSNYACTISRPQSTKFPYTVKIVGPVGGPIVVTNNYRFASPFIMGVHTTPNRVTLYGANFDGLTRYQPNIVTFTGITQGDRVLENCSNFPATTQTPGITTVICDSSDASVTFQQKRVTLTNPNTGLYIIQTRIPVCAPNGLFYSYSGASTTVTYADAVKYASMTKLMGSEQGYLAYIDNVSINNYITGAVIGSSPVIWSGAVGYNSNTLMYNNKIVTSNPPFSITYGSGDYSFDTNAKVTSPSGTNKLSFVIVYGILDPVVNTALIEPLSPAPYKTLAIPLSANFGWPLSTKPTSDFIGAIINIEYSKRLMLFNFPTLQTPNIATLNISINLSDNSSPFPALSKTLLYTPKFKQPNITKVDYFTSNHIMTIYGTDFAPKPYNYSLSGIEGCTPNYETFLATCAFSTDKLPYKDTYNITMESLGMTASYIWTNPEPVIDAITPSTLPLNGGKVTLFGKRIPQSNQLNMGTTPQLICTMVSQNGATFVCTLPSQTAAITLPTSTLMFNGMQAANPNALVIKYSFPSFETPPYQSGGSLVLTGDYSLYCSTIQISLYSKILAVSQTTTVCNTTNYIIDIDPNCESGTLVIFSGSTYQKTYDSFKLKPLITEVIIYPTPSESTIVGSFFDSTAKITIAGIVVQSLNGREPTRLRFPAPQGLSGKQTLVVSLGNGESATSIAEYPVLQPTITSIIATETNIEITGNYFGNDASILGLTQSPITRFQSITPTTISILKAPLAGSLRSGKVIISVNGLQSSPHVFYFEPRIIYTSQISVAGGPITIIGDYINLLSYAGEPLLSIEIDDVPCTQPVDIVGGIQCNAPAGSGKNHPLELLLANGATTISNISYRAPHISGVSSTTYNTTGLVTISGDSFAAKNLVVTIGGLVCTDPTVTPTSITCTFLSNVTIPEGSTSLITEVSVDGQPYSSYSFIYLATNICPSGCSNHGTCVNSQCVCEPQYNGARDCSVKLADKNTEITIIPPKVSPIAPEAIIGSNSTSSDKTEVLFDIGITHIREMYQNNTAHLTLAIADIQWTNFTATDNILSYIGSFPNQGLRLSVNVTVFGDSASTYDFAGDTFVVLPNAVKYQIEVSNWTFSSNLNFLQVVFITQTTRVEKSDCDREVTVASDASRVLEITKGSTVMRGRFSDRVIVDSRVAKSIVAPLSVSDTLSQEYALKSPDKVTTLTSVTSPYFINNLIIDPSFGSLLVAENPLDTCGGSSSSSTWKLPVIVVCAVIGASLIVLGAILIRKRLGYRTKLISLKLSRFGRKSSRR
eukprot:gene12132-14193_t